MGSPICARPAIFSSYGKNFKLKKEGIVKKFPMSVAPMSL